MGARSISAADEWRAGRLPIEPGRHYQWYPVADWHAGIVSVDRERAIVRLVAIRSRRPGSLRRLIDGATSYGWRVMIVEPTERMKETLTRWGWSGRRIEDEEIWCQTWGWAP